MALHLRPAQAIEELKETWMGWEDPQAAGQQGEPLVGNRRGLHWYLALCQPSDSKNDCCLTSTFQNFAQTSCMTNPNLEP